MKQNGILFVSAVGEIGGGESLILRILCGIDLARFRPHLACPHPSALAMQAQRCGATVIPINAPASFDEDAAFELAKGLSLEGARPPWARRRRLLSNYMRVL